MAAAYSATIFLSAALLFWLEPMFSKMVLPILGGTSAVWSVAMVVFQGLLLAGYVYAHVLTRLLRPRVAVLVHVLVLAVAVFSLPIAVAHGFDQVPAHGVSLWVVALFLASIGLPCFALCAHAPLLQAWFAASNHADADNPYFLYRASNIGSFTVLLAYPFIIEPSLGLSSQSRAWTFLYVVLALGIAACGALIVNSSTSNRAFSQQVRPTGSLARLQWVLLSFIPSGLLVAVTAHISTDVAAAPFLWIVPLALYLLTFVLAFTDRPLVPLKTWLALQPITVAALIILFLWSTNISWMIALPLHLAAFLVAAMICHTLLYRSRPEAADLTEFYAFMSLGGVLGGCFAALVAPHIFDTVLEYPLLILAALFVRPDVFTTPRITWLKDGKFVTVIAAASVLPFLLLRLQGSDRTVAYFVISVMTLAALLPFQLRHPVRLLGLSAILLLVTNILSPAQTIVERARSFYGAYKVADTGGGQFRVLFHGTIGHGGERVRDPRGHLLVSRPEPLTYYYRGGPYSEAIDAVRTRAGGRLRHVALIGLGMGALACDSQSGEGWDYYELDPLVAQIASDRRLFRSMAMCAPHARLILGDGRISLRHSRQPIDLLLLDAFTSDSVPVHLLTREAMALYKSRLSPHGFITFNISNRNVELASVVAASAAANGLVAAVKRDSLAAESSRTLHMAAEIAIVAQSRADLESLRLKGWRVLRPHPDVPVWTDDYSNIPAAIMRKLQER